MIRDSKHDDSKHDNRAGKRALATYQRRPTIAHRDAALALWWPAAEAAAVQWVRRKGARHGVDRKREVWAEVFLATTRALDGFRAAGGARFSTYLWHCVWRGLSRAAADESPGGGNAAIARDAYRRLIAQWSAESSEREVDSLRREQWLERIAEQLGTRRARTMAAALASEHLASTDAEAGRRAWQLPSGGDTPAQAAERNERRQLVRRALRRLRARHRRIVLAHAAGDTPATIAKREGCGTERIGEIVRAARARVTQYLAKRGVTSARDL